MTGHEFILKEIGFFIEGYYLDSSPCWPWNCTLNFETGSFECVNAYGVREYHLDESELIAFEKEIVDSHALDWTYDALHGCLDGRTWCLVMTYPDGTVKSLSAFNFIYNYSKLEQAFVFTEQRLRGGDVDQIDYMDGLELEDYDDLETAKKRYPEEFD